MLKKIHPLGKYAQGMHEKAEQEEEQRRQDDANTPIFVRMFVY